MTRHWREFSGVGAPFTEKMSNFYSGWVPVYVHPSLYSVLKVRFPMDVGGMSRDGRVTTNLSTGSLEPPLTLSRRLSKDAFKSCSSDLRGLRHPGECERFAR